MRSWRSRKTPPLHCLPRSVFCLFVPFFPCLPWKDCLRQCDGLFSHVHVSFVMVRGKRWEKWETQTLMKHNCCLQQDKCTSIQFLLLRNSALSQECSWFGQGTGHRTWAGSGPQTWFILFIFFNRFSLAYLSCLAFSKLTLRNDMAYSQVLTVVTLILTLGFGVSKCLGFLGQTYSYIQNI